MREKLLDLMKSEGLKPSQLAEMLGINPAGISHILAGRNKPGFDLLQKILRRFPRINPDWLLLDSDTMYRDAAAASSPVQPRNQSTPIADGLFTPAGELFDVHPDLSVANQPVDRATSSDELPKEPIRHRRNGSAEVTRVVIFYDDQTFESYSPTAR